jgi:hypothetical protein
MLFAELVRDDSLVAEVEELTVPAKRLFNS